MKFCCDERQDTALTKAPMEVSRYAGKVAE